MLYNKFLLKKKYSKNSDNSKDYFLTFHIPIKKTLYLSNIEEYYMLFIDTRRRKCKFANYIEEKNTRNIHPEK